MRYETQPQILAVDIGNSEIDGALIQRGDCIERARVELTAFQHSDQILEQFHHLDRTNLQIGLCSVNPIASKKFRLSIDTTFEVVEIGPHTPLTVAPDEQTRRHIGLDRLVNLEAACHFYEPPLCVIDCGTATTFTRADARGRFDGGLITLGLGASAHALSSAALNLPTVSLEKPDQLFPSNTEDAMRSGLLYGHVAMIDGLIDQLRHENGNHRTTICILTGGHAAQLSGLLKHPHSCNQDLTLFGIAHCLAPLAREDDV